MSENKTFKSNIQKIQIRGARVHNLKNINVDVPLNQIVAIAGVSGSGKSSLALGVLYAEGSRRYLESLSTYTRRRMTQASKASVDEILHVPAALALHQRPGVPGIRSTFGTGTELLNSLRLMYSRLASHCCPNGHYLAPTLAVAAGKELVCPECGIHFFAPSAEELAFNSQGACRTCNGTGTVRTVDLNTLVPDDSLTIDEGAVAPWNTLMWSLMTDVCREMGVRTNVPFKELTKQEKDIVFHGPAEKKHIFYHAKNSNQAGELDFTYFNAVYTVENALSKVKDEKGMKRVEKFLKEDICPDCHGSRLNERARAPKLQGISLAQACEMTLSQLTTWVDNVPASLPPEMLPMAESICESFQTASKRLMELGLGYLSLDRAASTLSTGERQRMQLARAVRNRTTGVLYVLDEPSIGLHPVNIVGLTGVMDDLIADGNSVILVDHDTQILSHADWLIEMGPEAGAKGGQVIAEGTIADIAKNKDSRIGAFLKPECMKRLRPVIMEDCLFEHGAVSLATGAIHTVKPLEVKIPKGRLTVVTGVSGSGKTTLLSILGTILRPDSGIYLLDGMEMTTDGIDLATIRNSRIGFVFQDHRLMPQYTVLENILLPALATASRCTREEIEYAHQLMELTHISKLAGQYPHTLSGGEASRVAVCRALIRKPLLVLADEPTGQLDKENARNIASLFSEINLRMRTTIVMVTHSDETSSFAHRILKLNGGILE